MVRHPIKDRGEDEKEIAKLLKELEGVRKQREGLDQNVDTLFEKAGLSPTEVSNYLDNPDNFTEQQWKRIQKNREEIQAFVWDALGEEKKERYLAEKKKKRGKKRKKKTLGSRRRGWIKLD